MSTPSIAASVYNQLRELDVTRRIAFLQKYVDDHQHETDWLDFKAGARINDVKDRRIEETWSKYLSAFGNSGGGILVWGIETSEDPATKKDCARGMSPVPQPGALLTRLDQMQHTLVNPPVQGVQFLDIVDPNPAANKSGYLVAYVPDGPHKPYRGEFSKQYYMRTGSHCSVIPPIVLRQMFYPHVEPNLGIEVIPRQNTLDAILTNYGTATASEVFIQVHIRTWIPIESCHQRDHWNMTVPEFKMEKDGYARLDLTSQVSIHPGVSIPFLSVAFQISQVHGAMVLTFTTYSMNQGGRQFEVKYDVREFGFSSPIDRRRAVEIPLIPPALA